MLCLIVGHPLVAAYSSNESDEAQAGRPKRTKGSPHAYGGYLSRLCGVGSERPPLNLARYRLDDAQVGVQRFTIATPQAERAFDEADCA